jgi:tRNA pseudouridine38-40 synthase
MRTLKLTLAYDGADFHGWQVQPERRTIQGTLAEALERIAGEKVLPQGSGRTDAGVHALGQVASFALESRIPTRGLLVALNDTLPPAIRVLSVDEVAPEFHARRSVRAKTYRYRIYRGDICPPFLARYVYHHPFPLDEAAMMRAVETVVGEHDFTSLAAVDPDRARRVLDEEDATSNVRTIFSSVFDRQTPEACTYGERAASQRDYELVYTVRGNGFLHHMVRNLVGLFLLAGKGTVKPEDIAGIIEARNRSANPGATAPAAGLYLVNVEYGE